MVFHGPELLRQHGVRRPRGLSTYGGKGFLCWHTVNAQLPQNSSSASSQCSARSATSLARSCHPGTRPWYADPSAPCKPIMGSHVRQRRRRSPRTGSQSRHAPRVPAPKQHACIRRSHSRRYPSRTGTLYCPKKHCTLACKCPCKWNVSCC